MEARSWHRLLRRRQAHRTGAAALAPRQELLGLGQSVILENGFWAREERDELRLGARRLGVAVELHYLEVPIDELWRRLKIRNELAVPDTVPIKREDLDKWALQFEAPD